MKEAGKDIFKNVSANLRKKLDGAIRATEWTDGEHGFSVLDSGIKDHDRTFLQEGGILKYIQTKQRTLARPMRILDYGCGTNQLARDITAACGTDTLCSGISAGDPRTDEERDFDATHNITFYNQTINALPDTGTFDLIVSKTTFIHLNDPLRALKQLYARLNEGGEMRIEMHKEVFAKGFYDGKDLDAAHRDASRVIEHMRANGLTIRFLDDNILQIIKTEGSPSEFPIQGIIEYQTPHNEFHGYGIYKLKD